MYSDLLTIALDDHVRRYNYSSPTCSSGLLIMIMASRVGRFVASCLKAVQDARATPPTCASGNSKTTYVAPTDGVICVFQVRGVPQWSFSQ